MNLTSERITCCYKREEVLKNGLSMTIYNKYFDKMRKSAHILISEGRQDELLPYLGSESVSIRRDIAGLLYNSYPELCKSIFREISEMTVETGLQKCYTIVVATAIDISKYGIPKDFP